MREYLYRGKSFDDGKWVYGSLIDAGNHEQTAIFPYRNRASSFSVRELVFYEMKPVDCDTVGEFTGQTDGVGTPIFEGDIVDIHGENGYWAVEWDRHTSAFVLANEADSIQVTFDNYYGHEMDVVGNIYDDKELLECTT